MASLDDIRRDIDDIDGEIVALVARRTQLVRQVVDHKLDHEDVRVPAREREVLANARRLATETGADPDVAEQVYRAMIEAFVEFERRMHRSTAARSAG